MAGTSLCPNLYIWSPGPYISFGLLRSRSVCPYLSAGIGRCSSAYGRRRSQSPLSLPLPHRHPNHIPVGASLLTLAFLESITSTKRKGALLHPPPPALLLLSLHLVKGRRMYGPCSAPSSGMGEILAVLDSFKENLATVRTEFRTVNSALLTRL